MGSGARRHSRIGAKGAGRRRQPLWRLGVVLGLVLAHSPFPAAASEIRDLEEPPITDDVRAHWAFRPLERPEVPKVKQVGRVRNPVDRFVLERLEANGLGLMPEASRPVLIRRLSFDLRGLPPTPEEIELFLTDGADDAYARLVDRFLESPAYGEQWAQYWLDLARFAESDGFEHDKIRPEAWRYRDWVIRALNEDLPYDRFLQMQLAGDEMFPGDPDAAVATGFLLAGPDMPDINLQEERRHVVLNEMTATVGTSLLGLGVGCAECHDHKYDPVSQADFYRLRAYFENTVHPVRDQPLGHCVTEPGPEAPAAHLMIRGDFRRPGPELAPAFPRITRGLELDPGAIQPTRTSSGRRAALARWITRPDHPLALRVIANRLWQHHFGMPLVATPNDFGLQGQKPTHPELLDWLATEIPARAWSLKDMHRLLLNSATYRQQSFGSGADWERARRLDPDNRWWSRMRRNRLPGETIRDALLAASGSLNREPGGAGVRPPLSAEITVTLLKNQWQVTPRVADHTRRSIYLFARRNLRYPFFDVFDRPDANASCARRHESTTAPQSLTLLNSDFTYDMARRLAGLVLAQASDSGRDAVIRCHLRALGRAPTEPEVSSALEFLERQSAALRQEGRATANLAAPLPDAGGMDDFGAAAWVDYCLALFNLSEFIYID